MHYNILSYLTGSFLTGHMEVKHSLLYYGLLIKGKENSYDDIQSPENGGLCKH